MIKNKNDIILNKNRINNEINNSDLIPNIIKELDKIKTLYQLDNIKTIKELKCQLNKFQFFGIIDFFNISILYDVQQDIFLSKLIKDEGTIEIDNESEILIGKKRYLIAKSNIICKYLINQLDKENLYANLILDIKNIFNNYISKNVDTVLNIENLTVNNFDNLILFYSEEIILKYINKFFSELVNSYNSDLLYKIYLCNFKNYELNSTAKSLFLLNKIWFYGGNIDKYIIEYIKLISLNINIHFKNLLFLISNENLYINNKKYIQIRKMSKEIFNLAIYNNLIDFNNLHLHNNEIMKKIFQKDLNILLFNELGFLNHKKKLIEDINYITERNYKYDYKNIANIDTVIINLPFQFRNKIDFEFYIFNNKMFNEKINNFISKIKFSYNRYNKIYINIFYYLSESIKNNITDEDIKEIEKLKDIIELFLKKENLVLLLNNKDIDVDELLSKIEVLKYEDYQEILKNNKILNLEGIK